MNDPRGPRKSKGPRINEDITADEVRVVGADGETHNGTYDISFLRCVPNITIFLPSDEAECRNMLHTAYHHKGLTAVRYPRGAGIGATENTEFEKLGIGKAELLRKTKKRKNKIALR